jgi:hypothetical protein
MRASRTDTGSLVANDVIQRSHCVVQRVAREVQRVIQIKAEQMERLFGVPAPKVDSLKSLQEEVHRQFPGHTGSH